MSAALSVPTQLTRQLLNQEAALQAEQSYELSMNEGYRHFMSLNIQQLELLIFWVDELYTKGKVSDYLYTVMLGCIIDRMKQIQQ
jgi:hypothetical protein